MSEEIITLDFQGHQIRGLIKEDGTIWFVASDCCKVLGIVNCPDALKRLYDCEKGSIVFNDRTPKGGNPNHIIITESGLYKLILRSSKPEAIKFQDWITQDVLPTIRREGGYINPNDYRDPYKIMENMMVQAKRMDETIKQQKTEIQELKPKAFMLEAFFEPSATDISFRTMAKLSKFITIDDGRPVGGQILKDKCIEEGLIGKKDRLPNQVYINKGYFKVIYSRLSNGALQPVSLITPKGQKWLYNRMCRSFNRTA